MEKSDSFWDKYDESLMETKTDNSYKSYKSYLSKSKYKDIISKFLDAGDTLYAHSLVDKEIDRIQKSLGDTTIPTKEKKDLTNTRSAFRDLQRFLRSNPIFCRIEKIPVKELEDTRNKIAKSSLHKIDGIDSIIRELGSDEKFIKLAVESSYFFSKEVVIKRHGEMRSEIDKRKDGKLPARKGKNEYTKISVEIDDDGNKAVRKLINDKTGYTIGQGKDSIFQNYNLSHVWGNAYDPRYFTSLWNIVVIPSWANHLMDKEAPEQGSIASKMINTYKQICKTLYFKDIQWKDIDLDEPQIEEISDREKGGRVKVKTVEYKLNIIKLKDKNKVGSIVQKEITISTK